MMSAPLMSSVSPLVSVIVMDFTGNRLSFGIPPPRLHAQQRQVPRAGCARRKRWPSRPGKQQGGETLTQGATAAASCEQQGANITRPDACPVCMHGEAL